MCKQKFTFGIKDNSLMYIWTYLRFRWLIGNIVAVEYDRFYLVFILKEDSIKTGS